MLTNMPADGAIQVRNRKVEGEYVHEIDCYCNRGLMKAEGALIRRAYDTIIQNFIPKLGKNEMYDDRKVIQLTNR